MQESLPKVRKNRAVWGTVALVVIAAFFLVWSLGNYGTPGKTGVSPAPILEGPAEGLSPAAPANSP